MGTGKKNTSWTSAIFSVLPVADQNAGSAKADVKFETPAQALCM